MSLIKLFSRENDNDKSLTKHPLIVSLINNENSNSFIDEYIKPEHRYFIKDLNVFDLNKLTSTTDFVNFVKLYTNIKPVETNRYLFLYLFDKIGEFKGTLIYDKFESTIYKFPRGIVSFNMLDKLPKLLSTSNDNDNNFNNKQISLLLESENVETMLISQYMYDIYAFVLIFDAKEKVYRCLRWTNYTRGIDKIPDIFKVLSNSDIKFKETYNNTFNNIPDITSISIDIDMYYSLKYNAVVIELVLSDIKQKLSVVFDFIDPTKVYETYVYRYSDKIRIS